MYSINGKSATNGNFFLANLQNKLLKCLNYHMNYTTFEHLSNSPQLSFLFVLKQRIHKGNIQGFGKHFKHSLEMFKHKNFSGVHSNVNTRASMKSSTNLSTSYECEKSPKHKIYITKFQTQT